MEMETIGILPAAGAASRIGNVPKFFLPVPARNFRESLKLGNGDPESLLKIHVQFQQHFCDLVVVVTRPEWHSSIEKHLADEKNVRVVSFNSRGLVESILMGCAAGVTFRPLSERFFLSLPDSVFDFADVRLKVNRVNTVKGENSELEMFCWKTSPETEGRFGEVNLSTGGSVVDHVDKPRVTRFGHFWGALGFSSAFLQGMNGSEDNLTNPIGQALKRQSENSSKVKGVAIEGDFFDVGTIAGYRSLLNNLSDS